MTTVEGQLPWANGRERRERIDALASAFAMLSRKAGHGNLADRNELDRMVTVGGFEQLASQVDAVEALCAAAVGQAREVLERLRSSA